MTKRFSVSALSSVAFLAACSADMQQQNAACVTGSCPPTMAASPATPSTQPPPPPVATGPVRIAAGDLVPMLVDATRAYYFDHADAAIKSVTIEGASPEVDFANARVDDYLSVLEDGSIVDITGDDAFTTATIRLRSKNAGTLNVPASFVSFTLPTSVQRTVSGYQVTGFANDGASVNLVRIAFADKSAPTFDQQVLARNVNAKGTVCGGVYPRLLAGTNGRGVAMYCRAGETALSAQVVESGGRLHDVATGVLAGAQLVAGTTFMYLDAAKSLHALSLDTYADRSVATNVSMVRSVGTEVTFATSQGLFLFNPASGTSTPLGANTLAASVTRVLASSSRFLLTATAAQGVWLVPRDGSAATLLGDGLVPSRDSAGRYTDGFDEAGTFAIYLDKSGSLVARSISNLMGAPLEISKTSDMAYALSEGFYFEEPLATVDPGLPDYLTLRNAFRYDFATQTRTLLAANARTPIPTDDAIVYATMGSAPDPGMYVAPIKP